MSWLLALRIQSKRLSTLLFSVFRNTILLIIGNSILTSLAYKCILDIYSREHFSINATLNELNLIKIARCSCHIQFVNLIRTRNCQQRQSKTSDRLTGRDRLGLVYFFSVLKELNLIELC